MFVNIGLQNGVLLCTVLQWLPVVDQIVDFLLPIWTLHSICALLQIPKKNSAHLCPHVQEHWLFGLIRSSPHAWILPMTVSSLSSVSCIIASIIFKFLSTTPWTIHSSSDDEMTLFLCRVSSRYQKYRGRGRDLIYNGSINSNFPSMLQCRGKQATAAIYVCVRLCPESRAKIRKKRDS
jgi:hypothetical protein